ncbi:hypothetical protein MOQ72_30015 [Saccharopolyspora sp. K220]|uniref:hypothetical protein n=1 Tax=Saccharopolyspora soli TaxID=2926618 RepID=UPI001F5A50A1|nr:hypothetical protein [Saccharopolyspora soli]MCI2421679.1 hypothetical protein [Saccharopolyspora soli]
MSQEGFKPTQEQLATVFEYAELQMSPERLAEKYEDYSTILALIRQASVRELGETVPATAFKAAWE